MNKEEIDEAFDMLLRKISNEREKEETRSIERTAALCNLSAQFTILNSKIEKGISLFEKITADITVSRLQKIASVIESVLDEFLTEEVKV